MDYHNDYFTTELLELIVDQLNLIGRQCDVNYDLNLRIAELYKFFGISMFMGVFGLSYCRNVWNWNWNVVADTMHRNRWESMHKTLLTIYR